MSQLFGKPSAPYRPPFGSRRDAVPAAPKHPARRLRRSHLLVASSAAVAPPLRPPRPGAHQFLSTPPPAPALALAPLPKPVPKPVPRKIQSRTLCASIQDRPVWAPAVALLQAGQTEPRWDKARLSSHDLAVRIGPSGAGPDGSSGRTCRFALVAASDIGQPDTTSKLQRLAAQTKNGARAAVVFLLSRDADGRAGTAGDIMAAYSELQQSLQETAVSILPLTSVETLPAAVAAFCGQSTTAAVATETPGDSRCRLHNLIRMYLGKPVPLSADGARKLVAACEAEAASASSLRRPTVTLKDVIVFCDDLKRKSPGRLGEILDHEDVLRMGTF